MTDLSNEDFQTETPSQELKYAKILFVIRSLGRGGAERQLVNLALGLKGRGVSVHVAVLYGGGSLGPELLDAEVDVHDLKKSSRYDLFGCYHRLCALVKELKPGFVHGYLPESNLLVALASRRSKPAKTVWGIRCAGISGQRISLPGRLLYWSETRLGKRADVIIANSQAGVREMVAKGLPESKLFAIPNGIDIDKFGIDSQGGARLRESLGISGGAPLFGIVGRHDQFKNHQLAIRALAQLNDPEAKLLCVGRSVGVLTENLKALSRMEGVETQVIWMEETPEMAAVYNALNVLVSVSVTEGFSNVVAEATSCGIGSVVTDVGDSAEIVGDLGEVVRDFIPEQVTAAMGRILKRSSEGGETYRQALRQSIVDRFTMEKLVDRTISVLYGGS